MRLPFAPLVEAVGSVYYLQHRPHGGSRWELCQGAPVTCIAELTGVNRRTMTRWVEIGIDPMDADRIACQLGFHVSEIWPEWWEEKGVQSEGAASAT